MAISSIRHRRLVQELRRHRQEAGYSQAEVSAELDWSESKQIKLENGNIPIKVTDVRVMCELYGVHGAEREALIQLSRDARQKGWWKSFDDAIPQWFEVFLGLENDASRFSVYQSELIEGLLQTPAYFAALMQLSPTARTDDEIARMIEVRKTRQARLEAADGPLYHAVLNEAALLRTPGSPELMREQLQYLLARMELPRVRVQVLPFAAGMHPAMDGPFVVVGFPESDVLDVVYLESQTGALYLEEQVQVRRYNEVFRHLSGRALGPEDSRALIMQKIREVT